MLRVLWPQIKGKRYRCAALRLDICPEIKAVFIIETALIPFTSLLYQNVRETALVKEVCWCKTNEGIDSAAQP